MEREVKRKIGRGKRKKCYKPLFLWRFAAFVVRAKQR